MKLSTLKGYAVGLVVGISMMAVGNAFAQDREDKRPQAHDAIVLCNHLAEDTAANVKLIQYEQAPEGEVLVYRCQRNGY